MTRGKLCKVLGCDAVIDERCSKYQQIGCALSTCRLTQCAARGAATSSTASASSVASWNSSTGSRARSAAAA
ncbi:hypothetical protein OEZ86_010849 [Tetradesmus obliquus]|nr:hypothetical protein OEZ86_010849 [Tetradesmus obliquus]